jgi:hypothetical protein
MTQGLREWDPQGDVGGSGNWSRPGVPHRGWTCVDDYDAEDDLITCEMCETAQVRFVHVMTNPRWEGELRVGCYCAARMEEDGRAAELREAELKRRARNPAIGAALSWVKAADEILDRGPLPWKEDEFVRKVRAEMAQSALPRVRKHYRMSGRQEQWFKSIYLRVVRGVGRGAVR